jgi:D-aminoacyl-tRNA deacylase
MRAVIQRVSQATVEVQGVIVGQIDKGLLIYLSIGKGDSEKDALFMAEKVSGLRIFSDDKGKMNINVTDAGGQILLISNFTLHGDCRKGRRPGFDGAQNPEIAQSLYEKTAKLIADKGITVAKGVFGANMQVRSINDGPITFILDSTGLF